MKDFVIAGQSIPPGEKRKIPLQVAKLYDFTEMSIPVEVICGKKPGPVLFVSGAIHGDEINGTEVIRRLLSQKLLSRIKGVLIAVPIVNVFGFNSKSRYFPDRRDLNRCFPGLKKGSLAAQVAYVFLKEVVEKSTHGIDLHTGSSHRYNLPQIRADMADPTVQKMAHAFGSPVIINSMRLRDGSLREAARELKIPVLLFEGGEALRFNEEVIRSGLYGVIAVMREIGMLPRLKRPEHHITEEKKTFVARASHWMRAPHSGIFVAKKKAGDQIKRKELLGIISDPLSEHRTEIRAARAGIIIGLTILPLVSRGDALFHIATFNCSKIVQEFIEPYQGDIDI